MYSTLLFDLDDTLLDFKAAEANALSLLFKEVGHELTDEIKALYQGINHARWQAYERQEMTAQEVVEGRFGLLFEQIGVSVDSIQLEKRYRSFLGQDHTLLGNSKGIIQDLARKTELYIVTNGIEATQIQRLEQSGFLSYFKGVFISGAIGYQKPQKEFFEVVFSHIPNLDKKKTVIVGDSLSSDIQGGINAGIDTIWLHKGNEKNPYVNPTYQIAQLEEIYDILES